MMDADQPSTLQAPLLMPDLPRVPPITITKNESQGYVISRGHHHIKITPGTEPSLSISEPTASSSYVVDYDTCAPQFCDFQTLAQDTIVRRTASSDSYSNTSQLTNANLKNQSAVLPERTSFQIIRNPVTPVTIHSGSVMSNPSCQHYSPLYSTSGSSHGALFASHSDVSRQPYGQGQANDSILTLDANELLRGSGQDISNYRPTTSSSSAASTSVAASTTPFSPSMSVDSSSYTLGQYSLRACSSSKSACTDPTFNSGAQICSSSSNSSGSRLAKNTVVGSCGSSIPFVDLTLYSNDVRNGHSHSSSYTPSTSDGSSCNSVAASSTSNVGYTDTLSPRESSKVITLPRPSFTDSQLKIKTVLSEITFLMKSVRMLMNEYPEKQSETPPQVEDTDSKDCMAQLQNFIAYSNMNTPRSQLVPRSKKLFTMCQKQCQKYFVMMIRKQSLSQDDEAMVYTMKLFLINLNKLFAVQGENANAASAAARHESVVTSRSTASKYSPADLEDAQDIRNGRTNTASFVKDHQIERYESLLKYKDSKINYLRTSLAEKKAVEEILEETKRKCAELEEKLKKKEAIGCWREDNISEWCCELMSELKTTMLNLLENEFKCCICDELLIQPGVTNCQHVFCTFCLNTWREKKKECPVCRALITNVFKVNAIDEYITAATSSLSDKAYAERLQVIEDRKNTNPPPAKKPNWSGSGLQSAAPPPPINQPRPTLSQHVPSSVLPFTLHHERNLPWLSDRLPFASTVHHPFPSSADIPTSGPWSQQNIPLNTAGVIGRRRPAYLGSIDAVDLPERRSSLDSYQ